MKRFFPRIAALALALILFGTGVPCAAVTDEAPEIGAEYAVIFNADDGGEILYGKNETKEVYCGFLPRVMTCLMILEQVKDLDETVTITKEMILNTPTMSNVNLTEGSKVPWRSLITCITVANAQEAAVAAAITLAGSLSSFVDQMNVRAKELGAANTYFTNVTGSFTSNTKQITTLSDCAKIISEALQHPEIAEAASQRIATITVNGKTRSIYTRNMLIETTSKYYNVAANGLFIYSETKSNSSIATYRKDSDRKIISLAITTEGLPALYKDAGALLTYSQNRYATRTILPAGKEMAEVKVIYGAEADHVILISGSSITALVPKIYSEDNVDLVFDLPESITAPVEKGTVLGTVTVYCGGKFYGTVDLKTQSSVSMDHFELYSTKLVNFFKQPYFWGTLLAIFVLVTAYILLGYLINRPKKRKRTPTGTTGGRIRMVGSGEEDDDE